MAAHQAPPSLGFSRQEHWSGLPFPSPVHESEKWKWSRSVMLDLSDPMDCSPPGSSVHGIFQARVLEWGAIAFSAQLLDSQTKNKKNKYTYSTILRVKSLYNNQIHDFKTPKYKNHSFQKIFQFLNLLIHKIFERTFSEKILVWIFFQSGTVYLRKGVPLRMFQIYLHFPQNMYWVPKN